MALALARRWAVATRHARGAVRCFGGDELQYEEQRQLQDVKSAAFYEEQGQARRYFYYVDLLVRVSAPFRRAAAALQRPPQGRLFLEDTVPKNIATSLKADKFLQFFFRQVSANRTGEHEDYVRGQRMGPRVCAAACAAPRSRSCRPAARSATTSSPRTRRW